MVRSETFYATGPPGEAYKYQEGFKSKHWTRVKLTITYKHSSLLRSRIFYGSKIFMTQAPGQAPDSKLKLVRFASIFIRRHRIPVNGLK